MKRCSRCKAEKQPVEFTKDAHRKDGLATDCKPCRRQAARASDARRLESYRAARSETAPTPSLPPPPPSAPRNEAVGPLPEFEIDVVEPEPEPVDPEAIRTIAILADTHHPEHNVGFWR